MRWSSRLVGLASACSMLVSCGGSTPVSVEGTDATIATTTTSTRATSTVATPSPNTTTSEATGPVSALGSSAERSLSRGTPTVGLLPGRLPFVDEATTGASRFSADSWTWTAGWNWIGHNQGTLPGGQEAGFDWSLTFSSAQATSSAAVPKNAVKLFSRGDLDYFALNSSCRFGEGTPTSTTIWVSRAGNVIVFGEVHETVARCDWKARTMTPEELVDLLDATVSCTFGGGNTPTCVDLPAVSADERSLAAVSYTHLRAHET